MPRKKRISDEDLLLLAEEVVLEMGADRLTLQQIAKRSGIAASTLLQRYGTKENLLQAIGDMEVARLGANLGGISYREFEENLPRLMSFLKTPERAANWLKWQLGAAPNPFQVAMQEGITRIWWQAAKSGEWDGGKGTAAARQVTDLIFQEILVWGLRREGELGRRLQERLEAYLRKLTLTVTPS
ncbi:TetR/AcrR family transcriptional regulator [Oscillatoria amoena NRMC-F 0135]|nr:TetR/AcrR family transcriptional regulator [Oscillatoria amoena NRMC-F 0135]